MKCEKCEAEFTIKEQAKTKGCCPSCGEKLPVDAYRDDAKVLLEVANDIRPTEGMARSESGQMAESDYDKAIEVIRETRTASVSHFQRKLGWGYDHACGVMDRLEKDGIVGLKMEGPREIFWDKIPRK